VIAVHPEIEVVIFDSPAHVGEGEAVKQAMVSAVRGSRVGVVGVGRGS
jgi:hypothetical protein